ncbi:hypothetical protein FACS18948_4640 [Clostridia bacterium]|nr:hypothetical protein FACS18948_4640 [Clostridia bacterium]
MSYEIASIDDLPELIDFLNLVFSHDHRPHDFPTMIPKTYANDAPLAKEAVHFIERADGRIKACVALLPTSLEVAGVRLLSGFIGQVGVHPYWRSKGSMKALMQMAREYAGAHGFDMLALTGQRQRYEYFDYVPAGIQAQYYIDHRNVRHGLGDTDAAGISFSEITDDGDPLIPALLDIYNSGSAAGSRTRETFLASGKTYEYRLYAILDFGSTVGYIIVNKDQANEFVLINPSDCGRVIKAWFETNKASRLTITQPMHAVLLRRELGVFAEGVEYSAELQLLPINWIAVLDAYMKLNTETRGLADGRYVFKLKGEDKPIALIVNGGKASAAFVDHKDAPNNTFSAIQATERIFSPFRLMDNIDDAPVGWFPLSLGYMTSEHF